ncbi:MAG: aspartate aminotransferase family protein [Candidatus Bathyarchaeia archaeon]
MNENAIFETERKLMANVYSKRDVVIVKGFGAKVWDINGNEYIDCMSGYGVALIGHSHPKIIQAIKEQIEKLIVCHGSLYNDTRSNFLKKLVEILPNGLNKVFLSNSGSEAIECAIKLARKHSGKKEIIAMVGAFHGKTLGALSATWNKKYRGPFEPLVPGFKHIPYGSLEDVKKAITDNTAGVLVEPIQGEGGVKISPNGFLNGLREICNKKNVLLIMDEVQTGLGRTGKMWACEHWDVIPDIICLGKAIAGGIPMGITAANEAIMDSLKIGEHSTTFGGNPLACAAGLATLNVIIEENLPKKAKELGDYFKEKLIEIKNKHKLVRDVRGLGLMIGVECRFDVYNIIMSMLKRKILIIDAGRNILRFLPPLVISKEQIDRVLEELDSALKEEENARTIS